jgi:DNA-binding MurR/RpiR family transcriptional regulator
LRDTDANSEANHEAAIAALLSTRTVRDAAKKCDLSEATLYRLLQSPDFKVKYRAARRELVEQTISQLQRDGADAATALRQIVKDKKAPASVRVSAAKVILEQGIKAVELMDVLERVERLEGLLSEHKNQSPGAGRR